MDVFHDRAKTKLYPTLVVYGSKKDNVLIHLENPEENKAVRITKVLSPNYTTDYQLNEHYGGFCMGFSLQQPN